MVVDYVWLNLCCSKEAAIDSIVYSYKLGFSGFAAKLTESEAKEIAGTFTLSTLSLTTFDQCILPQNFLIIINEYIPSVQSCFRVTRSYSCHA